MHSSCSKEKLSVDLFAFPNIYEYFLFRLFQTTKPFLEMTTWERSTLDFGDSEAGLMLSLTTGCQPTTVALPSEGHVTATNFGFLFSKRRTQSKFTYDPTDTTIPADKRRRIGNALNANITCPYEMIRFRIC